METSGGILARIGERVLGWVIFALILAAAIGIFMMGANGRAALWGGIWRTTSWVAITAVLPWSARLIIGRLLELGTNWAGVGLLAGFSLVNIITGVMLLTAWPAGFWGWFAALAALVAAGSYNYLVAEYVAEQGGR